MCQLLETIKCKNGKLLHLKEHNFRFNQARKVNFGLSEKIDLEKVIAVPKECRSGVFRCRVTYSETIDKIEFIPHHIREINTLKLVNSETVNYEFKFADRKKLNALFEKRGNCDDILIVKNGCITDSFTANPVFFDGKIWWTSDTPLLEGTQRAKLIEEGKISVCRITSSDLSKYKKVGLINALQNLEEMPVTDIKNIF